MAQEKAKYADKRPFKYSQEYHAWKRAVISNGKGSPREREADRAWKARYQVQTRVTSPRSMLSEMVGTEWVNAKVRGDG